MGRINTLHQTQTRTIKWQEKEEEEKERAQLVPSQDQPRLDFSSQSEELPVTSRKEDMQAVLELEPQSISQPSLSTSQLRSLNSQATPPRTTRRAELCQDTSSSPSATMRSSTSSLAELPLPQVVFSPTLTSSCFPRARVTMVAPRRVA